MAVGVPVEIATADTATAGTINLNITAEIEPGDAILLVFITSGLTTTLTSITDAVGNTYTTYGPYDSATYRLFYALCPSSVRKLFVNDTVSFNSPVGTSARLFKWVKIPRNTTG